MVTTFQILSLIMQAIGLWVSFEILKLLRGVSDSPETTSDSPKPTKKFSLIKKKPPEIEYEVLEEINPAEEGMS